MTYIHVPTQQDWNLLMQWLQEAGYRWNSGNKPTELDYWKDRNINTRVSLNDTGKTISRGHISGHHISDGTLYTVDQFLAANDSVTNIVPISSLPEAWPW